MLNSKAQTGIRIRSADCLGFLLALTYARFIPIVSSYKFKMILSAMIMVCVLKRCFNRRRYGMAFMILILLFCLETLSSALINKSDISWIGMQVYVIGTILFVYYCYQIKSIRPIYIFTCVCNIWVITSFFDVLIKIMSGFNSSTQTLILCGYDNGLGAYLIPILSLDLYFLLKGKNKIYMAISAALASAQVLMVWSATALAGMAMIIILYFVIKRKTVKRLLSPWILFAISWGIFAFVIVMRTYDIPIVRQIVEGVLHKSLDFTGRTAIWDRAFIFILRSPIFGSGRHFDYQKTFFLGVSSAHNFYLDVMCQSGIIGLFFLIFIQINLVFTSKMRDSVEERFLLNCVFLAMIAMQFESYCGYDGYPLFYFALMLAKFEKEIKWDIPYYRVHIT